MYGGEGWELTLYMRKGVTMIPTAAGTMAALNQVTQGETTRTPSSEASFMHSRFWAAAVRNSAEECTDVCIWDCTRKEPSLSAEGSPATEKGVGNAYRTVGILESG